MSKMAKTHSLIKEWSIGQSVNGESLEVWTIGKGPEIIHFYGGFHGDEPEAIDLTIQLKNYFLHNPHLFLDKTLIIVPLVNPDGFKNKTRVNANKVDLNRNFPAKDWSTHASQPKYYPGPGPGSEPEVQAIVRLILDHPPRKIISFHSLNPHQINFDGPAQKMAQAMAKLNGYPISKDIGYPTPGSLGSYAGRERNILIITYELPEKITPEKAWKEASRAIFKVITFPR